MKEGLKDLVLAWPGFPVRCLREICRCAAGGEGQGGVGVVPRKK